MSVEGELRVDVTWDGARVRAVKVRSTRPHIASQLVRGRATEAAVSLLSNVYAVCGVAHAAAAKTACDIARCGTVDVDLLHSRSRMVELEAIQEHCTRLGLYWSAAMHDPPLVRFVRQVRAGLESVLHGAPSARDVRSSLEMVAEQAAAYVFGMPARNWLDLATMSDLAAWRSNVVVSTARWWGHLTRDFPDLGRNAIDLMPEVDADALKSIIAPRIREDSRFAQAPNWEGRPVETGPLARRQTHPLVADALRQHGNTVATRLIARLTDLATLLEHDEPAAASVIGCSGHTGEGYAGALTARGLLVHRVVVRDDSVDDYAIVAPTEWNFHPEGAFASALAGCSASSESSLLHAAQVLTQAIDPCMPCYVEVGHA